MIRENTYLNAVNTAQALSERGIHLTTRPASLLGELLDLSASPFAVKTTDAPRILANSGAVSSNLLLAPEERAAAVAATTGDYPDPSQHSLKLMALAEDLAPQITAHISFARNTVLPLVLDLANKLDHYLTTARPTDPSSLFEIEQRGIPALALDESFTANGLENYTSVDVAWPGYFESLPATTDDTFFHELVNLGNERLNGLLKDWLGLKGLDLIKGVYYSNFCRYNDVPPEYAKRFGEFSLGNLNKGVVNAYTMLDVALALYIVATKLFENVQPAEGLSLTEYKTKLRGYIDFAGCAAVKAIRTIQRQLQNKVLVSEANVSLKKIVVNRAVYQEWLQTGGTPEVLFGMLASGEVLYAASAITEAKERLLRAWQSFSMLAAANVKTELYTRYVSYIENEFLTSLEAFTESEKAYAAEFPSVKAKIVLLAKQELMHLHHRVMDDPHHVALHLVAKARFYYTSAYTILNQMAVVQKENPDIDPREAALLSTINYIVEYFDEQLQIVK